jgi:hypothetical protein
MCLLRAKGDLFRGDISSATLLFVVSPGYWEPSHPLT